MGRGSKPTLIQRKAIAGVLFGLVPKNGKAVAREKVLKEVARGTGIEWSINTVRSTIEAYDIPLAIETPQGANPMERAWERIKALEARVGALEKR